MENGSLTNLNVILVGLVEMERFRYLYAVISLCIYLTNMIFCSAIVVVIWMDQTLHEPMYIFICNLIVNGMMGSTVFLPKLMIDLLFRYTTISVHGCLLQAFCIQSLTCVEMFTFAIMAFDRYLAVGHPLRYPSRMTNDRAVKCTAGIWVVSFVIQAVVVILTSRLRICGNSINNVYCESMSLVKLACGNTAINDIFGTIVALVISSFTNIVTAYSYIQTFIICLKISKEECQKAVHTLVTHLIAFSLFMCGTLFVIFRHRLNLGALSNIVHLILSVFGLTIAITINPVIYGLRTKVLRNKIVHYVHTIHICRRLVKPD